MLDRLGAPGPVPWTISILVLGLGLGCQGPFTTDSTVSAEPATIHDVSVTPDRFSLNIPGGTVNVALDVTLSDPDGGISRLRVHLPTGDLVEIRPDDVGYTWLELRPHDSVSDLATAHTAFFVTIDDDHLDGGRYELAVDVVDVSGAVSNRMFVGIDLAEGRSLID